MRYHEIVEGLDTQPVRWRWTERGQVTWAAQFRIGKMLYTVLIETVSRYMPTEISFVARDTTDKSDEHGTLQATGTGNARAVYSTVLDIVRKYLAIRGDTVNALEISSDVTERSRHRLNGHLAQKIAAMGGFEIEDQGDTYVLSRDTEDAQIAA